MHDGALKVARRVLDVPRADGAVMKGVAREIVRRPEAAAALVHDEARDAVLLAELFRAPVFDRGETGWMREIVAGVVEEGETPQAAIRRELMEEVGYRARRLTKIATVYVSPGYTTERIHIFYAPVSDRDFVDPAARGVDRGEDVARVWVPCRRFFASLPRCNDAKTLIAGQWLMSRLENDV